MRLIAARSCVRSDKEIGLDIDVTARAEAEATPEYSTPASEATAKALSVRRDALATNLEERSSRHKVIFIVEVYPPSALNWTLAVSTTLAFLPGAACQVQYMLV